MEIWIKAASGTIGDINLTLQDSSYNNSTTVNSRTYLTPITTTWQVLAIPCRPSRGTFNPAKPGSWTSTRTTVQSGNEEFYIAPSLRGALHRTPTPDPHPPNYLHSTASPTPKSTATATASRFTVTPVALGVSDGDPGARAPAPRPAPRRASPRSLRKHPDHTPTIPIPSRQPERRVVPVPTRRGRRRPDATAGPAGGS